MQVRVGTNIKLKKNNYLYERKIPTVSSLAVPADEPLLPDDPLLLDEPLLLPNRPDNRLRMFELPEPPPPFELSPPSPPFPCADR